MGFGPPGTECRAPKSRLAKTREKMRKMKVPCKIGLDKSSMVFW